MRGSFAEQPRIPRLGAGVWIGALLCSLAGGPAAKGYVFSFTNANWPLGEIPFSLLLGSAGRTVQDGNTSWDQVATDATGLWNAELTPVRLTTAPGNGF